jgi:hypothetical protein
MSNRDAVILLLTAHGIHAVLCTRFVVLQAVTRTRRPKITIWVIETQFWQEQHASGTNVTLAPRNLHSKVKPQVCPAHSCLALNLTRVLTYHRFVRGPWTIRLLMPEHRSLHNREPLRSYVRTSQRAHGHTYEDHRAEDTTYSRWMHLPQVGESDSSWFEVSAGFKSL